MNEDRAFKMPSPLNGQEQYFVIYKGVAYDSAKLSKARGIKQDTATGYLRAAYEHRRSIESLFVRQKGKAPVPKHLPPTFMRLKDVWLEEANQPIDDETTWRDILILAFCKSRGAV